MDRMTHPAKTPETTRENTATAFPESQSRTTEHGATGCMAATAFSMMTAMMQMQMQMQMPTT